MHVRHSLRVLFAALTCAVALLVTSRASAFCGFYVSGADTKLYNNATQVVLMRDGLKTILSMQNNYEGPPENFAMVVPVPVILQKENVKTLPKTIFDRIDTLDAPRLVEYWEQDPCAPAILPRTGGMGAAGPRRFAARTSDERETHGVTVEAQFVVGEYEIVILSAKDAAGLETWLTEQKYKIPEGSAPYFKPYIDQGSKFFVARVDVTKVAFENGMAALSPLRFHYDSDRFNLPIRLGLVNAKGTQDLIVHILAKHQRYEVSNYDNVTIPTNIDVAESARAEFGPFYASLYDRTLEKNPKAVITEYAWDAATCDPCPVPGLTGAELTLLGDDVVAQAAGPDAGTNTVGPNPMRVPGRMPFSQMRFGTWVLTRLHARYSKDSLGEDLVFRAADPLAGGRESIANDGKLEHGGVKGVVNNFQARYAIRHPWTGPIACAEPHRGRWGGPPPGDGGATTASRDEPVQAGRGLAFTKRDPTKLASWVRSDLPELGIAGPAAGAIPAVATTASNADAADVPATPPKKDCGCSVVSRTPLDPPLAVGGALACLALVVRRRRSR